MSLIAVTKFIKYHIWYITCYHWHVMSKCVLTQVHKKLNFFLLVAMLSRVSMLQHYVYVIDHLTIFPFDAFGSIF